MRRAPFCSRKEAPVTKEAEFLRRYPGVCWQAVFSSAHCIWLRETRVQPV